ncbi:MAG: YwaF family protein [Clostridiales bacterium]|nr:YwaF family protein [Clostridiales bacterium]
MDGFEHFCTGHLIILGLCPVFTFLATLATVKASDKLAGIVIKAMSIITLALEILQDILLTLEGGNIMNYLPLHLCNLGLFVNIIASFSYGRVRGFFSEVSLTLIAPGALLALITPDWNYRPLLSWLPLMCFATHILLVTIPVMMYARGYCRPSFRHFYYAYVFLVAVAVPIYIFDRATDKNYMFLLRTPKGTPLSWMESFMGNPGYLLGVLAMLALVLIVVYSLLSVIEKISKI